MDLASKIALWGLALQTLVLLVAIGMSFVKTRERMVKLETRSDNIESNTENLKTSHVSLASRVDGISRKVGILEGRIGR